MLSLLVGGNAVSTLAIVCMVVMGHDGCANMLLQNRRRDLGRIRRISVCG